MRCYPGRGFVVDRPNGLEHGQYIRRLYFINCLLSYQREGVGFEARLPLGSLFQTLPCGSAQINNAGSGFGEGRY